MSEVWKMIVTYAIVFSVGGALCAVAEILIVRTKLTPARILVLFLITGIVLEGIGVYDAMFKVCQAGISVPIVGFGAALAKGSIAAAKTYGFIGAFAGGWIRTAFGIGTAIVMSYIVTLVFSPKTK